MLMSSMAMAISFVPVVSAVNETNGSDGNNVINGIETWRNSHTLVGNVTVPPGAKLIINAGASISIAAGSALIVDGAICIGDNKCGATTGGTVQFNWQAAPDETASTWCKDIGFSGDASCGEGIVLNSGIDESISSIKKLTINGAYGYPLLVGQDVKEYAALIFDGVSIDVEEIIFSNINTSSILVTNQAAPVLKGGTFTVGNDNEGFRGPAISAYTSGKNPQERFKIMPIYDYNQNPPSVISNPEFIGTSNGCQQNSGKLTTIWISDSHVEFDGVKLIQNDEGSNADLGIFLRRSAGEIYNSDFTTECNGININSRRVIESGASEIHFPIFVNNSISVSNNAASVGIYQNGFVYLDNLDISGPQQGSGVSVSSSEVSIINSHIHNVTGYNGLYLYGESDISINNTKIENISRESVLLGEYHWDDSNWNTGSSQPYAARLKLTNSQIFNGGGTCDSKTVYGETGNTEGTFECPAVHIYMGSATLWNNTIEETVGDGIRVTGGIVDVRNNTVSAGEYPARVSSYNTKYPLGASGKEFSGKYGSIAYFSNNTWNVDSQTYNITESRVAVQSEIIPVPSAPGVYSIGMRWRGSAVKCENNMYTDCLQIPPMYSNLFSEYVYPKEMPMSIELNKNATEFAFADLDIGLENIHIGRLNSGAGKHQNIVQQGELVRYRVLANGEMVKNADVTIKDSHGNELYNLTTDKFGMTPQIVLASDFHLDFTGFGTNPDGLVTDPAENSCNDGIDNDGDLVYDLDDDDCNNGGRELSRYFIDAWKFDKGVKSEIITLTSQVDGVLELDNLKPSVEIGVQYPENTAFKRWINISGSSHDGSEDRSPGTYSSDWEAFLGHMGTVDRIEVRLPGGSWEDGVLATDTSGFTEDTVTKENWPWKSWSFSLDMSDQSEGDYPFEFRAFDGVEYGDVISRSFQLNTLPPNVVLTYPQDNSEHSGGSVLFRGIATDLYSGVNSPDLHKIHFKFTKDDGSTLPTEEFTPLNWNNWEYEWDFSAYSSGTYDVLIWASDSKFCRNSIDECNPVELKLVIDNDNKIPIIEIYGPSGEIQGSKLTRIFGYAADFDGDISRIEVNITDSTGGWTNLPNIYNLNGNEWETYWDTSELDHLSEYTITVVAHDADNYSQPKQMTVLILNPEDKINPPIFNQTSWDTFLNGGSTVKIFCDKDSKSIEKCGAGLEIDLSKFFESPSQDGLTLSIAGNKEDFNEHDQFMFSVLEINPQTGVLTYNPAQSAIGTYYSEESQWSFLGVKIKATDSYDQSVESTEFNIVVIPVEFTFEQFNEGEVNTDSPAVFIGTGRPGQFVKGYLTSGKISVGDTVVDEQGNWRLEIPRSFFPEDGGLIELEFEYASESYALANGISVESPSSGFSPLIIGIITISVIVVILGILAFLFIEIEKEDELSQENDIVEENPYAWANQQQQQQQQQHNHHNEAVQNQLNTSNYQNVTNPNFEAYIQQLISQGYDEYTARNYAEQYRDRF